MSDTSSQGASVQENLTRLITTFNSQLETGNDRSTRSQTGQFTTPAEVARRIGDLIEPDRPSIRVLYPGAGAGSLLLGLVSSLVSRSWSGDLTIDLIETDPLARDLLVDALKAAQLAAEVSDISLSSEIQSTDFLSLESDFDSAMYDAAILNPPYRKLGRDDLARSSVRNHYGFECPNIYASFLTASAGHLKPGGQLAAIVPRSFANGRYFKDFRRYLTDHLCFRKVALFDRRDQVFKASSVLQETVVFRGDVQAPTDSSTVKIETFADFTANPTNVVDVMHSDVVDRQDDDRFINFPNSDISLQASRDVAALPFDLADLGLTASTGPVVDFRARECLVPAGSPGAFPLIYPVNVKAPEVVWPVDTTKPQGFVPTEKHQKSLYPMGYYVLVKRFTAKEERRRVVASVFEPIADYESVAFENHVNVIHASKQPIDQQLAMKVARFLNSELVDDYFRVFSGSTQVNATDLRRFRFPDLLSAVNS